MSNVYEVRRKKFMAQIAEMREHQKIRRIDIAKIIGQKPEYISHVTNPDPQKRRIINETMARRIEKALGKERYWLDNGHDNATGGVATADVIADAVRLAQSVMDSYDREFSKEQRDQLNRAAIAAAFRQPFTESQYRVIIDLFITLQ